MDEALNSIHNDEYNGDKERAWDRKELTEDAVEKTNEPLLKKMLGKDWGKFFKAEQYYDHYQDNLI